MKKASAKSADSKPEADKAKRVYRAALDTIRRHDDILKQKKAYRDVFLPEAINLRNRLSDYCERLMFYDPLEFGRKAEELLWRKVYYDIIQLMKHNKKQMKPSSSLESAFRTHLMSAMGYYHHLMFRLQHEHNLRLDGIVDFYLVAEPRAHKKPYNPKKGDPNPHLVEWAYRACHRCLLYLGDIARYQQDYDEAGSRILSQRYYYQALALFPDMGMPHNQLGTLASSSHYNLDAAYHYLRCLTCQSTFEGAQGNLARLLEKNRRRHQELVAAVIQEHHQEHQKFGASKRVKDVKRFIVRFLHLLDIFYGGTNKVESRELQESCQSTLQDFNLVMFYQPPHVTNPGGGAASTSPCSDRPQYLEDALVMKVVIMCMMAVLNLERAGNKQMTAAIAFSLALFSHVLNHVVIRLQSALYELENPRRSMNAESPDLENNEEDNSHAEEEEILADEVDQIGAQSQERSDTKGQVKLEKKRHKLAELRRRRRRRRGDNEEGIGSSGDDSDLSEGDDIDSDSGDETINYLQEGEASSDSDSEDNLMVSQELRPGFSSSETQEGGNSGLNLEASLDLLQQSCLYTTLDGDMSGTLANGFSNSTNSEDALNDVTEYLKGLPTDFMTSTNNFFNQMRMDSLFPGSGRAGELSGEETDNSTNADLKAVVQGKKEVRVPPGFETSPDTRHVLEITEKLADFVIETDTDMSSMPTDTENSSLPTESELEGETTETDRESAESVIDKHELEEQRLDRLVQVISAEGLLRAIKVYCDWMSCHPHIIATCAQSSKSLWSRLAVLLNFLPLEADLCRKDLCEDMDVADQVRGAASRGWSPSEPLCEDLHLHKFPPLNDAHQSLNFDRATMLNPTTKQEAILRICCLRRFGYQVAQMKSIQFAYDAEKAMFLGPLQLEALLEEKKVTEKMAVVHHPADESIQKVSPRNSTLADAEARRNRLMRDMAQLRLQAEVSQLEGSLQSADQPSLPPYLVPDSSALCENLTQVKQLAQSARFIIIIPLAVIDQLDILKKESAGARQAIRWLEAEFRKGNRYVRAQKTHEKLSTVPHKNLKKRDKDAWRVLQMIDCCKYLSQQSSEWDSHGLVCVLTNLVTSSPLLSLRVRQAFATAMQEGLLIKSVPEFFSGWKDLPRTSKG